MDIQLTKGSLGRIMIGQMVPKPTLQILDHRIIPHGRQCATDRFRVVLSDSETSTSSCILAAEQNDLITSGQLHIFDVIKLEEYITKPIRPHGYVLIIVKLHILCSGETTNAIIGNPIPYKQVQVNHDDTTSRDTHMSNMSMCTNTAASETHTNEEVAVKGSSSQQICPIRSLTPYKTSWTIKVRVTQKSSIRTWSNARGDGKLFFMTLVDESGEINATAFRYEVDRFYDTIQVNKVYLVTNGSLKPANKRYAKVNNEYEMTLNTDTEICLCEEDGQLPTINYKFIPISDLQSHEPNTIIDVIGVVQSVGHIDTVIGKNSKKEIKKRDIKLVDESNTVVKLTLWGSDAENFEGSKHPVLAIKNCKLSDWNGRSLSALASSQIVVNPARKETIALEEWFKKTGLLTEFAEYSMQDSTTRSILDVPWGSLANVKSDCNIGKYYRVKALVVSVNKDRCIYMACPLPDCNKKLIERGNGMYLCEKCNRTYSTFKYRMILSANVADHTGNHWITCFQECAEYILGTTANDLGHMRETNIERFDYICKRACYKSYILKLRNKKATFNDEDHIKTICVQVKPVTFIDYNKKLHEDIEEMLKISH